MLCPVSHCFSLNSLNSDVGAVFLKPIVAYSSEFVGTFAAEVFGWEADIVPFISGKCHSARNASLSKISFGQKASLVLLCLVFISLDLKICIVVINKGPIDSWSIILHLDLYSIPGVSTPERRSLRAYLVNNQAKDEKQKSC